MTLVVVAADRGVRTHHFLAVNLSSNRDVLANGQPEDISLVGKRETVAATCQT